MPEYLHPGVFVEEISSGVRPIEGVSTSTAAFIGRAGRGRPNVATFVTSWDQFEKRFGAHIADSYLAYAVQHFFENGGRRCYVVRVLNVDSAQTSAVPLPSREAGALAPTSLRVTAKGAGRWGDGLAVRVEHPSTDAARAFRLVVLQDGRIVETHEGLTMDPSREDYVESVINENPDDPNQNPGASRFITVAVVGPTFAMPRAARATTNALADPVPFAAGETLTVELPDGTPVAPIAFAGPMARAAALTLIQQALGPLNLSARLSAAPDAAPNDRLVITHNGTGYDRYFLLGGTATAAGRPLDGLAGFAQGQGPAIGGVVKSVPGPFAIAIGADQLTFSVRGDALPAVTLTVGGARTAADIAGELNAGFRALGLLTARVEGSRVVVETVNQGAAESTVVVTGTAQGVLNFRGADRLLAQATGLGGSQPGFTVSAAGPFTLPTGSNLAIEVNNQAPGGPPVRVTVDLRADRFTNLQQVSATELAAVIQADITAAGAAITAEAVAGRVILRQGRRGNYYTIRVVDGLNSPNARIGFATQPQRGWVEGEPDSPYRRPDFNLLGADRTNTPRSLQNGDDGAAVVDTDYLGSGARRSGLHALDAVRDVNFISIPGIFSAGVIDGAVGYCETRKDCVFIADAPGGMTPVTEPTTAQDFKVNQLAKPASYGALYYPWVLVADPIGRGRNPRRYVPPSGLIAGLYARIDNTRGVWKAPAGTEATLTGAIALEYNVSDAEQDILNPPGVNCLRRFPDAGIVCWGARTLSAQADPEWRYVPVRRYAIYLEQSLLRGTQWVVFEPNDEDLWNSVRSNIDDFMMGEFLRGALAGTTPEQAFLVRVDADLNPPSEVNAGRLNIEVQFAPLRPAEFVIIRISQKMQRPES